MTLEVIILAAGQGTRMKSDLPKVLHPVAGRPMLAHVIDTAEKLGPAAIHVVVGHGAGNVQAALADYTVNWVLQDQQLGTGHAVLTALPAVGEDSAVLVLFGDVPLINPDSLRDLVDGAQVGPALLTAILDDPSGYGRIVRDGIGQLLGVVEHKDASDEQLAIREINTGVLASPARLLRQYLPQVGNNNAQGEYYLPDILGLAAGDGREIATTQVTSELEIMGINDRLQLNRVERAYQRQLADKLLQQGVHLADASRLDIRGELICGKDVQIDVNLVVEGRVVLGDGVSVGPNCVLQNVEVGDGSDILPMSVIQDAVIGRACSIGPYARLRPGARLAEGAKVGNFVEVKNAHIGAGSKANHLTYIGDTEMGEGVNIGAGTITCNYDGAHKHKTEIGDGVFVGSNSTLVAPLNIEKGGFVAAGSTVTRGVGEDELAVSRSKQRNIQGWKRPEKEQK